MTQSCGTVLSTTDEKLRHDELAFIDKYLARIWEFEPGSRAERRVLLSEVDEDQMKASLLQGALESHRIGKEIPDEPSQIPNEPSGIAIECSSDNDVVAGDEQQSVGKKRKSECWASLDAGVWSGHLGKYKATTRPVVALFRSGADPMVLMSTTMVESWGPTRGVQISKPTADR